MSLHLGFNRDWSIEVVSGRTAGMAAINKFGEATDIDIADGYADVWDGAGNVNADKVYTFSTSADIDSISSSNAGDTVDIEVQGLDSNWALTKQTVTLNGQTRIALSTPLIRVFRMKNVGASNLVGDVYCYVNGAITGGIPNTSADIRAIISQGNNQTLMAIYTIPLGYRGYLFSWYASISRKGEGITSNLNLFARKNGGVFQLKHSQDINTSGMSAYNHKYSTPQLYSEKTDIVMRANTTKDGTAISAGFDIVLEAI